MSTDKKQALNKDKKAIKSSPEIRYLGYDGPVYTMRQA